MPGFDDLIGSVGAAQATTRPAASGGFDALMQSFEPSPEEDVERSQKAGLSVGRSPQEHAAYMKEKGYSPETVKGIMGQYKGGLAEKQVRELENPAFSDSPWGAVKAAVRDTGKPFVSLLVNEQKQIQEAQKKIDEGNATDHDYLTVARAQHKAAGDEKVMKELGFVGGHVLLGARNAPAIVGEYMAGSNILKVGGALVPGKVGRVLTGEAGRRSPAKFLAAAPESRAAVIAANNATFLQVAGTHATRAALTNTLMPSMYVEQGRQNNLAAGREADDWRGYPAAWVHSYAQVAVLGSVLRSGVGAKPGIARGVAGALGTGAVGAVELNVADAATNLADSLIEKYVGPGRDKISTGPGVFEKLLAGETSAAGRKFAVDTFTLAMFSGMHRLSEGVGHERSIFEAKKVVEAAQKDLAGQKKLSKEAAAERVAEVVATINQKIARGEPVTGEETIAGKPSKLAQTVAEATKPAEPEKAAPAPLDYGAPEPKTTPHDQLTAKIGEGADSIKNTASLLNYEHPDIGPTAEKLAGQPVAEVRAALARQYPKMASSTLTQASAHISAHGKQLAEVMRTATENAAARNAWLETPEGRKWKADADAWGQQQAAIKTLQRKRDNIPKQRQVKHGPITYWEKVPESEQQAMRAEIDAKIAELRGSKPTPEKAQDAYAAHTDANLWDFAKAMGMTTKAKPSRQKAVEFLESKKITPEMMAGFKPQEAPGAAEPVRVAETPPVPEIVAPGAAEASGKPTEAAPSAELTPAEQYRRMTSGTGLGEPTAAPVKWLPDTGAIRLSEPQRVMSIKGEPKDVYKFQVGDKVGDVKIDVLEGGKSLKIDWGGLEGMKAVDPAAKNKLGQTVLNDAMRTIARLYPEAERASWTSTRNGKLYTKDFSQYRVEPKAEEGTRAPAEEPVPPETLADAFGKPMPAAERSIGQLRGGQENAPEIVVSEPPMREFGLKEAETAKLREENRLPPLVEGQPLADARAWGEMLDTMARDPQADTALIADLTNKMRATTEAENLLLLHRRIGLDNEYRRAMGQASLGVAQRLKGEIPRAEEDARFARAENLLAEIDRLDTIIDKTGTEAGRSLRSRRLMAREDYSLSVMTARAQNAKGEEPLTREEMTEIAALSKRIEDLTKSLGESKADTEGGKAEQSKARVEIKETQKEFAEKLDAFRWANLPPASKVKRMLVESLDFSRALKTAFDLSAGLRQGVIFALGHPVRFMRDVLPLGVKAFKSEREFQMQLDAIMQRENAVNYKRDGLPLMDVEGRTTAQEEAFIGRWVDWKPPTLALRGLLEGVKASGRSYSAMLNRIRADHYDMLAATLSKTGKPTAEEGAAIANAVSVFSGRAKLKEGGAVEKASALARFVLFAPRFVMSRFQLLAGQPLYGGTARTRKAIAAEYARALLGLGGLYLLASLDDDAKITFDPRSSDFGKIRFGNTRLDPLAGLSQTAVFITRLVSGEKETAKGKLVPLTNQGAFEAKGKIPYGGDDVDDVVINFLRSKLAPVPAAIWNARKGANVVGEPTTVASTAGSLTVPMVIGDVYKSLEEQGVPRGAILGLLAILGMGSQSYEPKRPGKKETTLEQFLR